MFPDELLQRNRTFAAKRVASPLPAPRAREIAVVACLDPRLDSLIRPALGLGANDGFLLRTSGALLTPECSELRSLAVAVLMFKVQQVFVLGHSSCKFARFESSKFIDSFRERGVRRDAFGSNDLRNWVGAIPSPREGVKRTLSAIATAPFIPTDVQLAGGVLDDTTGRIEMVVRPQEARSPALLAESVADEPETPLEAAKEELPAGMDQVLQTVEHLAQQPHMAVPVSRLNALLGNEESAPAQVDHLAAFLREAAADNVDIRAALARAKRELAGTPSGKLLRLVAPLIQKKLGG